MYEIHTFELREDGRISKCHAIMHATYAVTRRNLKKFHPTSRTLQRYRKCHINGSIDCFCFSNHDISDTSAALYRLPENFQAVTAMVITLCGLSLLWLVLFSAPRIFLRVLPFSSLHKNQQIPPGNSEEKSHSVDSTELLIYYLFYYKS